jgi:hypothetical protein
MPLIDHHQARRAQRRAAESGRPMNRDGLYGALNLMAAALLSATLAAPARADQWNVERAGFNLYQITGQSVFIRTEGCDDAPAKGVVDVQKDGGTRRMTLRGSSASCPVKDLLVPVEVEWSQYSVLLTRDQNNNWYRVTDSDLYLKTVGCISRGTSEPAVLDLTRSGTGWVRFADGRRCGVEHAYRRMTP